MHTDGSRLDSGAAGYAVTWQNGQRWMGVKTHMGYNQEGYDATDAQTAIRRLVSEDPVPDRSTRYRREGILQLYGGPA
jgi:hypothetical protein